jgi:hypothetical protein
MFFGGVTAFAVLAIWVSIAGFADMRRMFRELNEERDNQQ